jgi:RNA polymerase sigma factor (sigma-70 family)
MLSSTPAGTVGQPRGHGGSFGPVHLGGEPQAWVVATVWVMEAMSGGAAVADEVLLRRVTGGDSAALTVLYSRHGDALFRYLLRLCVDRMLAEEVLQDTLLAVWRGADTYRGRAGVRSWLFGIARRQAYQHLRLREAPVPAELPEIADSASGPDELAILAVGGTPVAAAVTRLPTHHREVVALALVAGLPLVEVAEVLGVPVGTVKSRLHHARAALVKALSAVEGR